MPFEIWIEPEPADCGVRVIGSLPLRNLSVAFFYHDYHEISQLY